MSSNFSVNTENTPTFGAGLQYALTPAWSLELGYRHASIKGTAEPFETSMNLFTLKNFISLNQIFFVNRISERVNPFLSFGIGYDFFNYEDSEEKFTAHNSSYNAGAGIAYKLSNTIDLFTHYEYHLGSNAIDNDVEGWGSDLINSVTGGVRINFGKKDTKHPSWRPVPVDISPADYDLFVRQSNVIDDLRYRVDNLEQDNDEITQYTSVIDKKSAEIDSLKTHIDKLNQRITKLENSFSNLREENNIVKKEVDKETGLTVSLPGGHYVQIFATYNLGIAQDVREHAIQYLKNRVQNPEEEIFIIHRKQFYEVMIGFFNNFESADDIKEVMTQIHNDAYVITFPRPVNLKPDFEGIEVLEDIIQATH
jgi:prefoldin subunit 5